MRVLRIGLLVPVAAALILGGIGFPGGESPAGNAAAATAQSSVGGGSAAVRLVLDGRPLGTDPPPVIVDGRTLVPMRAIFEALGAQIGWEEATRTVTAGRGSGWVRVRVDQRLGCLEPGCSRAALLDVPPRIRNDRTLVPVRFVTTALGLTVRWDDASRTVFLDSGGVGSDPLPSPVAIATVRSGQTITDPLELRLSANGTLPSGAAEVRYLLLDSETGRGPIVARGAAFEATYRWLPDPAHDGGRLLAAALYDGAGRFLAGDVVPVRMDVRPRVSLAGVSPGQRVSGPVTLTAGVNFVATHVTYQLLDQETGAVTTLADADPEGSFNWTPRSAHNGAWLLRATAHDRLGRVYHGTPVPITVEIATSLTLTGIAAGRAVERPVNLGIAVNFPVNETRYILRDPDTGAEEVLARVSGAGGHRWLPGPAQAGQREVAAVVTDAEGREHRSPPVAVEVRGAPALFLETVGPNQVLAGEVRLRVLANVPLDRVEYRLVHPSTGSVRTIAAVAAVADAAATHTWNPAAGDAGAWLLHVAGTTRAEEPLLSEKVPVRVHAGPLYGPRPVIEKDKFREFASGLALPSLDRTGMSAALQVAQAILETGWGQSSPVDKYTGRVSHNLFGIKGSGPAGSVTSNTWEEYNGVAYRVDADFRAYNNVTESWDDHKRLLLTAARYEPFRAVMHEGTRGAWALRRAGYATDSQYPVKLINLMKQHNLYTIDDVEP